MSDDVDVVEAPGPPPEELRAALRDLIPAYHGPADPLLRVGASIRRRRSRRRALLAVSSAAAAVVLVSGVPAVLGGIGPGTAGITPGRVPAGSDPATAGPPTPLPPPPVHLVARGVVAGSLWQVGSTSPGGAARRCLRTDGGGFDRDLVCFDAWRAGDPVSWYAVVVRRDGRAVTQVAGVAPTGAASVVVRLGSGPPVEARAVRTGTDPGARFFAVLVAGEAPVLSVAARRADGTALGEPVTEASEPTCRESRSNACAAVPTPSG